MNPALCHTGHKISLTFQRSLVMGGGGGGDGGTLPPPFIL